MAESASFRDLLSLPTDQVERPRDFPDCWLLAKCANHEYGQDKSGHFVQFTFAPESPAEAPDGTKVNGSEEEELVRTIALFNAARRTLRRKFWVTPEDLYKISDFLDSILGKESGRSFRERVPDTRGASVIIHVTQRPRDDDDTRVYNNIREIIAA